MTVILSNNARSLLAASITASDTLVRVRAGHGDRFPNPTNVGDWFPLTLEDANGAIEIMKATSRSGDTITVQRGAENTQARAFNTGDTVEHRLTAATLNDIKNCGLTPSLLSVSIGDGSLG